MLEVFTISNQSLMLLLLLRGTRTFPGFAQHDTIAPGTKITEYKYNTRTCTRIYLSARFCCTKCTNNNIRPATKQTHFVLVLAGAADPRVVSCCDNSRLVFGRTSPECASPIYPICQLTETGKYRCDDENVDKEREIDSNSQNKKINYERLRLRRSPRGRSTKVAMRTRNAMFGGWSKMLQSSGSAQILFGSFEWMRKMQHRNGYCMLVYG